VAEKSETGEEVENADGLGTALTEEEVAELENLEGSMYGEAGETGEAPEGEDETKDAEGEGDEEPTEEDPWEKERAEYDAKVVALRRDMFHERNKRQAMEEEVRQLREAAQAKAVEPAPKVSEERVQVEFDEDGVAYVPASALQKLAPQAPPAQPLTPAGQPPPQVQQMQARAKERYDTIKAGAIKADPAREEPWNDIEAGYNEVTVALQEATSKGITFRSEDEALEYLDVEGISNEVLEKHPSINSMESLIAASRSDRALLRLVDSAVDASETTEEEPGEEKAPLQEPKRTPASRLSKKPRGIGSSRGRGRQSKTTLEEVASMDPEELISLPDDVVARLEKEAINFDK
jgi:hypothetical protein